MHVKYFLLYGYPYVVIIIMSVGTGVLLHTINVSKSRFLYFILHALLYRKESFLYAWQIHQNGPLDKFYAICIYVF